MTPDTPDVPPHLRPFVLPYEPVEPTSSAQLDLYLPAATPAPGVLMVHGGPVPPEHRVRPPQWPAYRAYGALLAKAGLVGAMVEHGFVDDEALPRARDDVRSALATLRADHRVDAGRVGLWFFSSGGLLMGSFLEPVPEGVAAVAGLHRDGRPRPRGQRPGPGGRCGAPDLRTASPGAARARLRVDRTDDR